jgi:phosphonate transport system substrate-binding protein
MTNNAPSFRRIVAAVVPLALVVVAGTYWWSARVEADARRAMERDILADMLGSVSHKEKLSAKFVDHDGDLVADSPTDASECVAPERLVFSYIAVGEGSDTDQDEQGRKQLWEDFLAALSTKTGLPVDYRHFSQTNEQLAAVEHGEVHVVGLNTGAVDAAVQQYGIVPSCTLGRADGSFGYTMKLIVPAASQIQSPAELQGKTVTFVRPNSNSGFKAAFVYLLDAHELLPERDYDWRFSLDHDKSIRQVAARQTDAAAVASDVLEQMIQTAQIEPDSVREIYESESFPPATIGYAHNLTPELRDAIRQTLIEFDWHGTGLEAEFGPMGAERFVAVNYKDDWANIRRIERSVERARSGL